MKLLSFFLGVCFCVTLKAQEVQFGPQQKDFGKIGEAQGVVQHLFEFTNQGGEPVQIDSVGTSCGCTATRFSNGPVAAGASGFVEVQFDPNNRPGPFDKSVVVKFTGKERLYYLNITGFVTPKPASIPQEFPVVVGHLRMKNRFLNLGNVDNRGMASKSFEVYNQGDEILVFSDEMEGPNHVTITFEPYTLKPHSRGKLWVHYDVAAKGDLGYFREDVSIFTYEGQQRRKDLITSVTIMDVPARPKTSAPSIGFDKRIMDFGIKKQGDTVRIRYRINNTGKDILKINKAFSSCNCVQLQLQDQQVAAGASTNLDVVFYTDQRLGNQQKNITIFSSDPRQPVSVLTLKGLLRGPRN